MRSDRNRSCGSNGDMEGSIVVNEMGGNMEGEMEGGKRYVSRSVGKHTLASRGTDALQIRLASVSPRNPSSRWACDVMCAVEGCMRCGCISEDTSTLRQ